MYDRAASGSEISQPHNGGDNRHSFREQTEELWHTLGIEVKPDEVLPDPHTQTLITTYPASMIEEGQKIRFSEEKIGKWLENHRKLIPRVASNMASLNSYKSLSPDGKVLALIATSAFGVNPTEFQPTQFVLANNPWIQNFVETHPEPPKPWGFWRKSPPSPLMNLTETINSTVVDWLLQHMGNQHNNAIFNGGIQPVLRQILSGAEFLMRHSTAQDTRIVFNQL